MLSMYHLKLIQCVYETALKYVTSFIVVFTAILLQTCKINQTETIAQGRNIYDG